MPCILVDEIEFEPLAGDNLRVTFVTGGERLQFAISRGLAVRSAYNVIASVAEATVGALVLPFDRKG